MHRCARFALFLLAFPVFGVERWGVYEITLSGPAQGNPYLEVHVGAQFRFHNRVVNADGFYDGDGTYKIRFMPDEVGEWSYLTESATSVHCYSGHEGKPRSGASPLRDALWI